MNEPDGRDGDKTHPLVVRHVAGIGNTADQVAIYQCGMAGSEAIRRTVPSRLDKAANAKQGNDGSRALGPVELVEP